MHQLELWTQGQARAAAPSTRLRRVVQAHSGRSASSVLAASCIDPDLVPEIPHDPELVRLRVDVNEFVRQARAGATRKAYSSDWRLFEAWCARYGEQALPTSPVTLALYLAHLAKLGRKYSTIRRARTAIGQVHAAARLGRPDLDARVRTLERGIGRSIGTREKGASPLCVAELALAIGTLHNSVRDVRDRALLLLGFACGYRASDLVTLDVEHVQFREGALHVFLPRSKEDQLGRGRTTTIPTAMLAALCPVHALQSWLELAALCTGPLFRVISGARVCDERMHPRAVSRAVQRAAKRAGIPGDYSSHSLRAGLATSADAHGHSLRAIQHHVGWLDARTPTRYIDPSRGPERSVVVGLL